MFKVELERLPQSPGNPSKVLTSDSVSTLKEAGSVRKTARKNTARPIPRAEQLLIRLAEALPDTLFDYSALFPSI
jgi:tubulin polyglutamylase TTLL5